MALNIGDFLTRRAKLSPDREGLVCDNLRLTYSQMNARANRLANAMKKLGIGSGDRVAILAWNSPEYFDLFFGLGKIGAILVPVNWRLAAPEIEYIAADCEAKVFIFGKMFEEVTSSIKGKIPAETFICIGDPPSWAASYDDFLGAAPADEPELAGGDDDALNILYTSGTTGRPKGALLTHHGYFNTAITMLATFGLEMGDSFLVVLPLFHIGALAAVPMFAHLGIRCVLMRNFDPKRFLELLSEEKITAFGSVPQILAFLKFVPDFAKYDWSSVKIILVYAAPVPVTLLKEYAAAGIEVRQLYGLTECTGPASVIDGEHAIVKAGSCGLPMFHSDIKLVDDGGKEVGPGELGEVLIKADNVMKGYLNKPEETAKAIRDGWLYTGDLAKMDEDGYLYILDRKKDMIISGGENIYPAEIEDIILGNPKVADVGVIGFDHPKWGEAVKAVVVLKPGQSMSEDELIKWCQGRMGKFKIPKQVVFTAQLPRTPTGKILKREMRDQFNK